MQREEKYQVDKFFLDKFLIKERKTQNSQLANAHLHPLKRNARHRRLIWFFFFKRFHRSLSEGSRGTVLPAKAASLFFVVCFCGLHCYHPLLDDRKNAFTVVLLLIVKLFLALVLR